MDWTVSKTTDVCTDIKIDYAHGEWEQWALITSDVHSDNPHSRIDLYKKHLKQAKARGAFVMDFGDWFDAMQGRNDRRSNKSDLKPSNTEGAYFNALVRDGYDILKPFKDNLALWGKGNHESAVLKHNEIDLTEMLVDRLSAAGSPIVAGTYRGWIRFHFNNNGGSKRGIKAYYTHGAGGGGPVTKGVIGTNRKAVYVRDADLVIQGHIHEEWVIPITQVGIDWVGNEKIYTQNHVTIPGYKSEFLNCGGGFHHEKGGVPKPTGAFWIRFYWSTEHKTIRYQLIKADD